MGKDLTEVRSSQRKLAPDTVGSDKRKPTSLRGIANKAKSVRLARKRVQPRNRMRENFTSGSVRGVPGNRHSYRGDGWIESFMRFGVSHREWVP